MNRKISFVLLLLAVVAFVGEASATSTIKNNFTTLYGVAGTRIDSCDTCHIPGQTPSFSTLNPYGKDLFNDSAYATNVTQSMINVEPKDSDNDGFTNINEIHNLTFPGNASDFPPVITSFTPASPVTDVVGASRTFTVTVNQPLNVVWLINGAQVQNTPTAGANNQSMYTNTSAAQGTWNVSAIAQKAGDGTAMQTWTWNVGAPAPAGTFNISGFKINNATGSGVQGWNITLENSTMQTSMLTGADGSYKFMSLVNGTYNVTEELKAGWMNVSPMSQQVIIKGADMMNINFTNQPPTKATFNISGFKINDTNGNGVWDAGEMGIENWNINLFNDSGTPVASTSTNDSGFYQFTNLMPDRYNVTEEMKPGFTPTNATTRTVIVENMDVTNVNFTNTPSALNGSISGFKFNDINGNKMWDPVEPGLPDWMIVLTMPDGSNMTATTNADGFYKFSNLSAGNYTIEEVLKPGWVRTFPSVPVRSITLMAGENLSDIDFGNMQVPQGTFSISGFKINDTNGNGVRDSGEMGIENWNIRLLNATTGAQIASTLTNDSGFYRFTNLTPGTYNVTEEMKAGFTPVTAVFKVVTIENMDVTGVNFLNKVKVTPPPKTNTISGFKINDLNGNGKRDEGEKGLPGWNIRLIGIVPETAGIDMETTTDDQGFYSFENLPSGMYLVEETVKGDFVPTGPPVIVVTLENGMNSMNNNFMNRPVSSLIPDMSGVLAEKKITEKD